MTFQGSCLALATATVLAGCAGSPVGGGGAPAVACQPVSTQEIAALFVRWNDALRSGDPQQVVAQYAPQSVLLPTLSDKTRLSAAEKADYFVHFLRNKPSGRIDSRTILLGCNTAVDVGTYTFSFADGSRVGARYTYTYAWDGARWLITSHHSSAMPGAH